MSLTGITGAWLNPKKQDGERGRVVRNMTTTPYKALSLRSVGGRPLEVPFDFYPEFKPQTFGVEFRLIINDGQTSKKYNVQAYQGNVTVIEPPKNWLDPQLWSVYLIFAGLLAAAGYAAKQYLAPAPQQKSKKSGAGGARGGAAKPAAVASSSSSSSKAYDEDWIPEHHLKSRRSTRSAGGLSSGDEDGRKSPSGKKRGGRR